MMGPRIVRCGAGFLRDANKILQQPNQGPEVARNKAAALAQGEYLVFLDSDDFFFPFALETFDQVIKKFDSPPLVLGKMAFFTRLQGKNRRSRALTR